MYDLKTIINTANLTALRRLKVIPVVTQALLDSKAQRPSFGSEFGNPYLINCAHVRPIASEQNIREPTTRHRRNELIRIKTEETTQGNDIVLHCFVQP